eukprot:m.4689 g.4689  ORF g.4689 m.4689 type:complete len:444 (+) comp2277_c0_seq1:88-1419(+)
MPLESTVVCMDNSEFMRNGDFSPNRLQAECDAANLVINTKLRDNPESSVAVLTMGHKIDVRSTLTTDKSKLNHCLHDIDTHGDCDFLSGIMVAQLILRHRETKNHRQRVVTFVGSPVQATEKELVQLGKKLKKSNVNVDVISFGEEDENQAKLEAFINAVNKENESHLVVVPSGSGSLSDSIMASPMFGTENVGGARGDDFGAFGNADMDNDPELAMALRLSLEEERQRQQRLQGDEAGVEHTQETEGGDQMEMEDDELAAALLASQGDLESDDEEAEMNEEEDGGEDDGEDDGEDGALKEEDTSFSSHDQQQTEAEEPNFGAMTEEEMYNYALQLSMQDTSVPSNTSTGASKTTQSTSSSTKVEKEEEDMKPKEPEKDEIEERAEDIFDDPDFLASVMDDLPGVNKDDAMFDEVFAALHGGAEKKTPKSKEPGENDIDDVDD